MIPILFAEDDSSQFESALNTSMAAPIAHFEKELASIRTGRASTALLDDIKVECYGQMMNIKELATIAAPEARLITVQPWDKTNIDGIEKALRISDLGINPINDGTLIRLQLPMMSTERREELIKQLGKKTEECRVGIRNVRKEFHNQLRTAEKEKHISEDWAKRLNDKLQKITDEFIKKAEAVAQKKEGELRL